MDAHLELASMELSNEQASSLNCLCVPMVDALHQDHSADDSGVIQTLHTFPKALGHFMPIVSNCISEHRLAAQVGFSLNSKVEFNRLG
jgi:hypothetical protein